jgi:hypothetical protein
MEVAGRDAELLFVAGDEEPRVEHVVGRDRVVHALEALGVLDGQHGNAPPRQLGADPMRFGHVQVTPDEPAAVRPDQRRAGRLARAPVAPGGDGAVPPVDGQVCHVDTSSPGHGISTPHPTRARQRLHLFAWLPLFALLGGRRPDGVPGACQLFDRARASSGSLGLQPLASRGRPR